MKFWKEHKIFRIALMTAFFLAGLTLVLVGRGQPGQMSGLLLMLAGLVLLLAALYVYNKPFTESKKHR